jgi:hypothetical protein
MGTSCRKRFIIDSGDFVKKVLCFDVASAPALADGLCSGLSAYSTNVPKVGSPTTLWLRSGVIPPLMMHAKSRGYAARANF